MLRRITWILININLKNIWFNFANSPIRLRPLPLIILNLNQIILRRWNLATFCKWRLKAIIVVCIRVWCYVYYRQNLIIKLTIILKISRSIIDSQCLNLVLNFIFDFVCDCWFFFFWEGEEFYFYWGIIFRFMVYHLIDFLTQFESDSILLFHLNLLLNFLHHLLFEISHQTHFALHSNFFQFYLFLRKNWWFFLMFLTFPRLLRKIKAICNGNFSSLLFFKFYNLHWHFTDSRLCLLLLT